MTRRLAIVVSHPIQYQVPWYRELARRPGIELDVLYGHQATAEDQATAGFGTGFEWDIPLLGGYRHTFLGNVAASPSTNTPDGIDTPSIGRVLREGRYHAVLVSGWHTRSYRQTIRACWQQKLPLMVRGDSHLHDARPLWKKLIKELPYRWLIGKMDACLAVGSWSREYFLHYGARPERVFLAPHSASLPVPRAPEADVRRRAREQWGLPPDATVFLLAGKLIALKRPLAFIAALAAARGSHVYGLVAGDGPLRAEAEALARSLNARIRFAGFLNQSEIAAAYLASDALVLPSSLETWGMVVNEAMMFGLPCIVSRNVGAGPDLVIPGETGFTFGGDDVQELARLLDTPPEELRRMGASARRKVSAYTPASTADGVEQALSVIAEAG